MSADDKVTVWGCDECGYWRQEKSTGVQIMKHHLAPRVIRVDHLVRPAVYSLYLLVPASFIEESE